MNRRTPDESLFFPLSMRGTCPDLKEVKLYTDRSSFEADQVISFDNEFEGITSISYFLGSLLSSCILTAKKAILEAGLDLDEIEGKIDAQLTQPLSLIPVQGCNEPSDIKDIQIKIYYYANAEEEEVKKIISEAQEKNPVLRLINRSCPVQLSMEMVL